MDDLDSVRSDTLSVDADEFDQVGQLLAQSGMSGAYLTTERIEINTGQSTYLVTAENGSVKVERVSESGGESEGGGQ